MIPSTFTSTVRFRPLRTFLIGQLARIFAIFGVTHVFVYHDEDPLFDSHALGRYIVKVLRYAVTPPWLKKEAFPKESTDRWFGLVPPLQIEAHERERIGPWSWGVERGHLVPLFRGRPADPMDLTRRYYIGFWAEYIPEPLGKALEVVSKKFGNAVLVGTSRRGDPIWARDVRETLRLLRGDWVVVFGGPHRGIFEMGVGRESFHAVVNIYPRQRTKTIRMEEAVALALEAFSMILHE